MWMETDRRDGTRVTVGMGFDGRCRGGGLKEAWASRIPARQTVRVRGGEFSANLTGVARNLGNVRGRTGEFSWRLVGRFVEDAVVNATVTGTAELKLNGRVISRCKIDEPASVRLAIRSR
jgi:hypothetical protein